LNWKILPINSYSNYEDIRKNMCYFKDNTDIVQRIEQNKDIRIFAFLRPPRFGKSLLLSVLKHYYDINNGPYFKFLFEVILSSCILNVLQGTKASQFAAGEGYKPNRDLVFSITFSAMEKHLKVNDIFHSCLGSALENFSHQYGELIGFSSYIYEQGSNTALGSFKTMLEAVENSSYCVCSYY
jgi:hypothetical protein